MNRVYWVWLLQVLGPHNVKAVELYNEYKDIVEIYNAISSGRVKLTSAESKRVKKFSLETANKIVNWCDKCNVKIIALDSEKYPNRLSLIYNPPILLFCLGSLDYVDDEIVIGIVGTRKPSEYSVNAAAQICSNLAKLGVVTVSGFAVGIDSVAHGCSLREKEKTIAVLGCGIDYNYPKQNAKLKKVIATNGAVITEYLPGTPPLPENFPERNRIISGLSQGVLIIEADVKSGSLITAEHAISQGRDVFCLPPASIFDRRYAGVIKYIRDGAIPVFSHLDIVYTYYDDLQEKINPENPYGDYSLDLENQLAKNSKEEKEKKQTRTKKDKTEEINEDKSNRSKEIDLDLYDEIQQEIIKLLQNEDLIADEISRMTGYDIGEVLSSLTELEILGTIKITAGQRYTIA